MRIWVKRICRLECHIVSHALSLFPVLADQVENSERGHRSVCVMHLARGLVKVRGNRCFYECLLAGVTVTPLAGRHCQSLWIIPSFISCVVTQPICWTVKTTALGFKTSILQFHRVVRQYQRFYKRVLPFLSNKWSLKTNPFSSRLVRDSNGRTF